MEFGEEETEENIESTLYALFINLNVFRGVCVCIRVWEKERQRDDKYPAVLIYLFDVPSVYSDNLLGP